MDAMSTNVAGGVLGGANGLNPSGMAANLGFPAGLPALPADLDVPSELLHLAAPAVVQDAAPAGASSASKPARVNGDAAEAGGGPDGEPTGAKRASKGRRRASRTSWSNAGADGGGGGSGGGSSRGGVSTFVRNLFDTVTAARKSGIASFLPTGGFAVFRPQDFLLAIGATMAASDVQSTFLRQVGVV